MIHYTFGAAAEGGGRPLNGKTLLLAGVILLLSVALAIGIATRREATIKVQRGGNGEVRRLAGGAIVNVYSAYLENRAAMAATFEIAVPAPAGYRLELLGPVREIHLPANGNRRIDFTVKVSPVPGTPRKLEIRLMRDGKPIAVAPVTLLVK